ncbi:LemA family protein [Candidatus Vampirococcus lugosii]|uniref:Membrane protein n=1 Tax=Candidatus Vampirococcus lugosii TaxID=2789015 RepID=A0ABS5QMQ5_9BACT|nr:LemA family protein [Candidatus Vampirococcus lugosii]MBS8122486.1 membrane protein [Candidatus Vampirococcus lugosii]
MNLFFYILVLITILLSIGIIIIYNKIIKYKNFVENSYRLIDINLQKRADLIPNLVKIINQYQNYEKDVLSELVNTRNFIKKTSSLDNKRQEQEKKLSYNLKNIFANIEKYPDIKANENFLKLQNEISRIEENLSGSKKIYNSNLNILNTTKQTFPYNLIANLINIPEYKYFEFEK